MKRLTIVLLLAVLLPSYAHAAGFVPPAGQKLLIIGQDTGSIADYVSTVGITPAGVTGYTGINTLAGFTSNGEWGAGINNAATLTSTYPNSVLVMGISLNGQTAAFANGAFDANLDTLINTLKGWNRPVLLRWGYEVEGPWNAHPPAAFKTGWIKVWNRIRALNAQNNIAMVWQTATYCGDGVSVAQTLDWYPGDQYVDWMAMSYFTPQDCGSVEITDMIALARAHAKPLLIAEASPQRYDIGALTYSTDGALGSNKQSKTASQIWAEWFATMFNVINANPDVVKGLAYINADWHSQWKWNPTDGIGPPEGYWGDSRVQAQSLIRTNWLAQIGANGWLAGSGTLFNTLGFGGGGGGGDNQVPTVPGNLRVTATTGNSITLAWNASTDNVGVSAYQIYRGAAQVGSSGTLSFVNTALAANTAYTYTIRACDAAGNCSGQSAPVTGTTTSAPASGQGIEVAGGIATLYFNDAGWTGTWNYLCLSDHCVAGTKVGSRWQRTINEQAITIGNSYPIQIKIQNTSSSGGQVVSPTTTVVAAAAGGGGGDGDSQAPTVPANLRSTGATSNSVTLAWNASTDNVRVSRYELRRGGSLVASPTATSATDSGLAASTTYAYTVRACDAAGNCSANTSAVNATTNVATPGGAAQGIEVRNGVATLYFNDAGWTGSWNYLCLQESCISGTKVGGRWQRTLTESGITVGNTYQVQIKIQNVSSGGGQYISPMTAVSALAVP